MINPNPITIASAIQVLTGKQNNIAKLVTNPITAKIGTFPMLRGEKESFFKWHTESQFNYRSIDKNEYYENAHCCYFCY